MGDWHYIKNSIVTNSLQDVLVQEDFVHWIRAFYWSRNVPGKIGLYMTIMAWVIATPGYQQPKYWLCSRNSSLCFTGKDFKYLYHHGIDTHVELTRICCCYFGCSGTGRRFSNRKETNCLPLLNAGFEPGTLEPNLQQTKCPMTNRLSYGESS